MRRTRKTSLWVAAVTVLTSLPAFAGEGDAGVARISDTSQKSAPRTSTQAKSPIQQASFQGCTDGGCAATPVADPVSTPCGPGGCGTSSSGGSSFGGSSSGGSLFGGSGGSLFGGSSSGNSSRGGIFGNGGSASNRSTFSGSGTRSAASNAVRKTAGKVSGSASGWWQNQLAMRRARTARHNAALKRAFCPSGNCGQGAPPIGHYNMVYAADPNHFDQRDGSLYSAQGYGTPVTVPLAPNVHHQFNYGWGMPSSRITQISTPAGYSVQRPIHW